MLLLVSNDHLQDRRIVGAPGCDRLERALTHLAQVIASVGGAQERQLCAARARRADPQILERGDVAEIPRERAHQLGVHRLEDSGGERFDERERALARVPKGVQRTA